ncbi:MULTISPECIES: type II secretion system protein [unclassified Oleiphilus]|uniref:type II secretion system protein n=1 Tax=unclassified Oleiphilus TaxID=2631174 RepID=UPI0007C25210|nr:MULTISPECIES: type II secretion system protein [unclassified Oleiphilus]KZY47056.1 hypothetical protein A3732_00945 [Oleiphilus sp. HI0050]KZZ37153.1 hypothetical protein A3757_01925 [Oleiphilus sp. HI0117]KZZ37551.1 hypothetical protein A3756_11065 [Oleiphilus sp. HI0086]
MSRPLNDSKGFTLIEMIVTIVVIGILGVGIAGFIGRTTEGMIDASERGKISAIAWVVSEKLSRELRLALPNSIQTLSGGSCIEFIPTVAATDYLSVPILSGASSFEVVPFASYVDASVDTSQDRVAVYSNAVSDVYDLSGSQRVISSLLSSITAGATAGALTINLQSSHQFVSDSPTKRLFISQDPVMFCFSGGFLYRYFDYGFDSTPDTNKQNVMANGANLGSFAYTDASLTRNAVVNIAYSVTGSNGELQAVNQEVQIRNVP